MPEQVSELKKPRIDAVPCRYVGVLQEVKQETSKKTGKPYWVAEVEVDGGYQPINVFIDEETYEKWNRHLLNGNEPIPLNLWAQGQLSFTLRE